MTAAPVLDWDDETDDLTPDFIVDFDEADVVEGNTVSIKVYSNAGLTHLVTSLTHDITAAEILAGTFDFSGSALADNWTYYVKVRVESGDWSNTETVVLGDGVTGPEPPYTLEVADATSSFSGPGGSGGAPWPAKRRSIDFEKMYRHIDAVTEANRLEKQARLARIDKTIAEAVDALSTKAQELGSPQPKAVIKSATVVRKQLDKQLASALTGEPVKSGLFSKTVDLQAQLNTLVSEMQAAQERLAAREREIEDDDEDILMLMD